MMWRLILLASSAPMWATDLIIHFCPFSRLRRTKYVSGIPIWSEEKLLHLSIARDGHHGGENLFTIDY